MIISALKSNDPKDQRSPIHSDTLSALINTGAEIFFEEGIGDGINTSDHEFENAGLKAASRSECISKSNLIITNQALESEELSLIQ